MGFMDELKKLAKPYSEDADDDFDEFDDDNRKPNYRADRANRTSSAPAPAASSSLFDDMDDSLSGTSSRRSSGGSKVVNIHATTQLKVVLVKPERFENASEIADHLKEKRTVVINLESTNKDIARRLIDFLSGVAYAGEGKIKKVAANTYIITPYHVDIMGDLIDELENNGLYL